MNRHSLFGAVIRDRRRAWLWWTGALVATALLIVVSFGAVEGQESLNESIDEIPESLHVLLGLDEELTLTSPAGYLNSQWFANLLPILLSIYGIGLAARVLAGEESDGRLELVIAHPVARLRVLADRGAAVVVLLIALFLASSAVIITLAPFFDLTGIGIGALTAASWAALLLALLPTAIVYGVAAWTGSRGMAIAIGAAVTAGGFLLQSLANTSDVLRPVRWITPWHWFVDAKPVIDGWRPVLLPSLAALIVCAAAVAVGAARFRTRDIRSR